MTSSLTPKLNDSPSQRRPLRGIKNRKARFKHETPLIKKVLRKTIKGRPLPRPPPLPPPPPPPPQSRYDGYPKPLIRGQARERGAIETRRLSSPKQFDNAVRIFSYVRSIRGRLFCYVPHFDGQNRDALEIQLRHTRCHNWRVVEGIYSRKCSSFWPVNAHRVRQWRRAVVRDVRTLCAVHIACKIDVSQLAFFQMRDWPPRFFPILDAFDLDIYSEQDADWAQLETDMVRKVEAQFLAIEFIAKLRSGRLSEPYLNMQFDPGAVLQIFHAKFPNWSYQIQQVGYTLEKVYIIINYHLLRLTSADEDVQQQDVEVLRHRAVLLILEAAVLVQLHAQYTVPERLKDIPQLRHPCAADSYISTDGFDLAIKAYSEARDAIQALYHAGGTLEDVAYYLHDASPAD